MGELFRRGFLRAAPLRRKPAFCLAREFGCLCGDLVPELSREQPGKLDLGYPVRSEPSNELRLEIVEHGWMLCHEPTGFLVGAELIFAFVFRQEARAFLVA